MRKLLHLLAIPRRIPVIHSGLQVPLHFPSFLRKPARISVKVFKWACIIYCINTYVVDIFVCIGSSMEPTIFSHDIVLTEHLTQRFGHLRRGDAVIARSPQDPTTIICKRIIATHGDLVYDDQFKPVKVPRGHVWLEGDNPSDSFDSRRYGPVAEGLILSKILLRVWPPNRFGTLANQRRKSLDGEDFEADDYLVPENPRFGDTIRFRR